MTPLADRISALFSSLRVSDFLPPSTYKKLQKGITLAGVPLMNNLIVPPGSLTTVVILFLDELKGIFNRMSPSSFSYLNLSSSSSISIYHTS
jgi:hypothetical protein